MKRVDYLIELGWAYWRSQVIFAGVELGVFDLLAQDGKNPLEIARGLNTNPRATEMLLNALVALKLLKRKGDIYLNTFLASQYLVRGVPFYQADRIRHQHNLWDKWSRLQQAIRTGKSVVEDKETDPEKLLEFMKAMHNNGTVKAQKILRKFNLKPSRRLLDLGAGPGTYSIEFARVNPRLQAVVYDLPDNAEIAKTFIKESGLEGRITTQAGNCLEENLGEGLYDAIFVSNLLHIYAPTTNVEILRKCYRALEPGGKVIIHDFFVNKARTGPLFSTLFSLNMLLGTCEGAAYSKEEFKGWLLEAEFKAIKTITLDRDSALIIGGKK